MSDKRNGTSWIGETDKDGDYSDLDSRYEKQVGNITDAVLAEAEALDRGDKVEWMDSSIDTSRPCRISTRSKIFNLRM